MIVEFDNWEHCYVGSGFTVEMPTAPLVGESVTIEVEVLPDRLRALNVSLNDLFEAIERNNATAGGGYLVRSGSPDAIDSIVPMAYGNLAFDLITRGIHGRLVVLRNGRYDNLPIEVITSTKKLVDVDALMTDAANALGVTFSYNMSKESAEDYGELPDELLATPAVVG